MTRDPKIDPQPGDILACFGMVRTVTKRMGGEVRYTRPAAGGKTFKGACFVTTWKAWAKNAVTLPKGG